jgi:hypothetical protein
MRVRGLSLHNGERTGGGGHQKVLYTLFILWSGGLQESSVQKWVMIIAAIVNSASPLHQRAAAARVELTKAAETGVF